MPNFARKGRWPPPIDRVVCSAFTVAELGEMLKGKAVLPVWTNKDELKQLAKLGVSDARAQKMVSQGDGLRYWDDPRQTYKTMRCANKEADGRAKTLIEVIEGRHLSVDGKITIKDNGKNREDI